LHEDAAGKNFFAQTTTQKKIVCLENIFIPPLQKNNGLSLKDQLSGSGKKAAGLPVIIVMSKINCN